MASEKQGYNLIPQKKTVLPAHLMKGLTKRAKKMIEAYQIKIKKAVGGRKVSKFESKKNSIPSEVDMNYSTKTNTFSPERTQTGKEIERKFKLLNGFSPT